MNNPHFTPMQGHATLLPRSSFRIGQCAALTALVVLTAGCAGTPDTVSCGDPDWVALGREDALAGDKDGRYDSMAKACEDIGLVANLAGYRLGFEEGLKQYCTPKGGFNAGRAGNDYKRICPTSTEVAFLSAYDLGERLRKLEQRERSARRSVAQARKDRTRNAYRLKDAYARLRNTYAAGPEVAAAHRDVEYHTSEVQRLDSDIPKMENTAVEAKIELDALKTELMQTGMLTSAD